LRIHRRAGNRNQRQRKHKGKERSDWNQDNNNEETDIIRGNDEAEEINITRASKNVPSDNAALTNAEIENDTVVQTYQTLQESKYWPPGAKPN
jgi:hypothetical protein